MMVRGWYVALSSTPPNDVIERTDSTRSVVQERRACLDWLVDGWVGGVR